MEKPKPRGGYRENAGRPRKDESEKRRTRSILLTDAEYAALTGIAEKRGVSRSDLIAGWVMQEQKK